MTWSAVQEKISQVFSWLFVFAFYQHKFLYECLISLFSLLKWRIWLLKDDLWLHCILKFSHLNGSSACWINPQEFVISSLQAYQNSPQLWKTLDIKWLSVSSTAWKKMIWRRPGLRGVYLFRQPSNKACAYCITAHKCLTFSVGEKDDSEEKCPLTISCTFQISLAIRNCKNMDSKLHAYTQYLNSVQLKNSSSSVMLFLYTCFVQRT